MSYIALEYIRIYFQTLNLTFGLINHEDNELSNSKFAFFHFSVSSQKEVNCKYSELMAFKYAFVCGYLYRIGCKANTGNFLNWKNK